MLHERADRLGIVASTLCAIHCMGGAVLAGVAGAGALFADERIEAVFVAVAVAAALGALLNGCRAHRRAAPLVVGCAGLSVLAVAHLIQFARPSTETTLSVLGSSVLIGAHVLNLRSLHLRATDCPGGGSRPIRGD